MLAANAASGETPKSPEAVRHLSIAGDCCCCTEGFLPSAVTPCILQLCNGSPNPNRVLYKPPGLQQTYHGSLCYIPCNRDMMTRVQHSAQ